jgi:ribosome-associated heat shock protein Hsp15
MKTEKGGVVRIDKWLWAVRVFKTRSQVADPCKAGKIKVEGNPLKASKEVRVGEVYSVQTGPLTRIIKVTALLHNRMAAKFVPQYMEDLTPAENLEQLKIIKEMRQGIRPRGFGRPTKKERRDLEDFGAL